MIRKLIVAWILLFSSVAMAAPECKLQPVETPCVGTLMPLSTSTEALVCLKTCAKTWKIKLDSLKSLRALDLKSFGEKEMIYRRTINSLEKIVDKSLAARVAEVEDTPFYKTTEFAFGAGVTVGAVAATIMVYGVGQAMSGLQK